MKTVSIIGLGLMGGSFAKALKMLNPAPLIFACDTDANVLKQALTDGVVDKVFLPEQSSDFLKKTDFTIICLYPRLTFEFLKQHASSIKKNSIIIDISGVKSELEKNLLAMSNTERELFNQFTFVPAHPMAGSEKEGYEHSSALIFTGRNFLFIPYKPLTEKNRHFLETFARNIGFSSVIFTDVQTHDHNIAFTSQLCHIIAAALVDCAENDTITQFGGGSYEDLTRISMINVPLWTELFLENRENLLYHIDRFEQSLAILRTLVKDSQNDKIQEILHKVRTRRIAMSAVK